MSGRALSSAIIFSIKGLGEFGELSERLGDEIPHGCVFGFQGGDPGFGRDETSLSLGEDINTTFV